MLAAELWGESTTNSAGEHHFGKGRVVWGENLTTLFAADNFPSDVDLHGAAEADFRFTHRASPAADIYFVSNQKDRPEKTDCVFRIAGRQPELWNAVTGEHRALTDWTVQNGWTLVPLEFAAHQSWFVVFREPASPPAQPAPNFPSAKPLAELTGSWEVTFPPDRGAPAKVVFDQLTDWTKRPEEGIQHFSGKAMYQKMFEIPELKPSVGLILDLGNVRDIATVRVNGKELATLWTAPWSVDITSAVKPGNNILEVEVVNEWNNRLVGDAGLPPKERLTWVASGRFKAKSPLLPSGLLGPVTLQIKTK